MPDPLDRLIQLLARLPGVGRRSAERMAWALARDPAGLTRELSVVLADTAQRMTSCSRCGNITTRAEDPCRLCTDPHRDDRILCVVEDPADLIWIERSGAFRGRYHALMGRLSPMRGEGVTNTRMDALLARLKPEGIQEVVLALNADMESDATCSFLSEALRAQGVSVTRLARGLPTGSGVGYADSATLARALEHRQRF
jgi:recombination protein RecR